MQSFTSIADLLGGSIDLAGVLVIVLGISVATARFVIGLRDPAQDVYRRFRVDLGRSILLGLEFLVAGDIVRTVAVAPSLVNVLVLGGIVLIRTFLSATLQVELEGRWPWADGARTAASADERQPRRDP